MDKKHFTIINYIYSFDICLYDLGPIVLYWPNLSYGSFIALSVNLTLALFAWIKHPYIISHIIGSTSMDGTMFFKSVSNS